MYKATSLTIPGYLVTRNSPSIEAEGDGMQTHLLRSKYLLLLGAGILVVASALVFGVMPIKHDAKGQQQERKRVTKLPLIISKVKKLEVINVVIERPDGPDTVAVLEIRNNSDLAVMAIEIGTGDRNNWSAVARDGLDDPEHPTAIIPPHETIKMEMGFGGMLPDFPLEISGASFADGTEEGEDWALGDFHGGRAHSKQQREAEKAGSPK
jgi:hypothetical protein